MKPSTAIVAALLAAGATLIGFACGSATRAPAAHPRGASASVGDGGNGLLARFASGGAALFGRGYGGSRYGADAYGGGQYGDAYGEELGDDLPGYPEEYDLPRGGLGYAGTLYGMGGYGGTRYGNYYFDARAAGAGQRGAPPPYATGYSTMEVLRGGSIVGRVTWPHAPRAPRELAHAGGERACGDSIPNESLVVDARGSVANAVVYLEDIRRGRSGIAAASPRAAYGHDYGFRYGRRLQIGGVVETIGCRFLPHVQLLAPRGAVLRLKNGDAGQRTVRARQWSDSSRDLIFSQTLAGGAAPQGVRLDRDGFVELRSLEDGEAANAWVVVQAHPYYALTDESGLFRLDEIPPGVYRLAVWHEPVVLGVDAGGSLVLGEPVVKHAKVRVRVGVTTRLDVALDRLR